MELKRLPFAEARREILRLGGYIPTGPTMDAEDGSVAFVRDGEAAGIVACFVRDRVAGWHDGTSAIPFVAASDADTRAAAAESIAGWVADLLDSGRVDAVKLLPDEFLRAALERRSRLVRLDNIRVYGYFDLSRSPDEAWRAVRRRYRPLINRGQRELQRTAYNAPQDVPAEVVSFLLAGAGITRLRIDGVFERMARGQETLLVYRKDAELIGAAAHCPWDRFRAEGDLLYDLGAYNHHGSCPAHFCLYDSLTHYRAAGASRVYLLHGVPPQRDPGDTKLAGIDFFKRGYCTDFFCRAYQVLARDEASALRARDGMVRPARHPCAPAMTIPADELPGPGVRH